MDEYIFLIPVVLVGCLFIFFGWKLWGETEESGRGWMKAVVMWSMPVVMAIFHNLFHRAIGVETLLVGEIYAIALTCILRRINKNAG